MVRSMQKSIYSQEYRVFLGELRAARERAGMTQEALAKRLGQTQTFVSKCERGERRLDVVELRAFCAALGISLPAFLSNVERALTKRRERK